MAPTMPTAPLTSPIWKPRMVTASGAARKTGPSNLGYGLPRCFPLARGCGRGKENSPRQTKVRCGDPHSRCQGARVVVFEGSPRRTGSQVLAPDAGERP